MRGIPTDTLMGIKRLPSVVKAAALVVSQEPVVPQARDSHLDFTRAPYCYVLYGVKYLDPITLAPLSTLVRRVLRR